VTTTGRVLVSTSSFGTTGRRPLEMLEAAGLDVTLNPHGRKLRPEETRQLLVGVDGLLAGTELLSREILQEAKSLRVVSRCGTGMDGVDLDAAAELGIAVRNTPDSHVDAVAELALAGMLDLLRQLSAADRDLRSGRWKKPMGALLGGKTVGLVGLGRIGKRLAELLGPFGVSLLATDPMEDPDLAARVGVRYTTLEALLRESDIVSLHLPFAAGQAPLLARSGIRAMKPGAFLVNCARGGIVDEVALAEALRDGHLGGAYLDVFAEEPYTGPLVELRNVLLSPHMGSYAAECRLAMETQAVENLLPFFPQEANP
jgi:D-3-phosphoglycerate dehydrogenase